MRTGKQTASSGIGAIVSASTCLLMALAMCLGSQTAFGGSITIQNNSFELVDCSDLGGGQATSWNTGGGGVFDPQNAQFTGTTGDNVQGELPAGGQVGNVWFGLSQNLGVAATPGATYTVNFYIGWRWDKPSAPSFRVLLLEGANTVIDQVVTAAGKGFALAAPLSGVATGSGTLTLIFTNNTGVSDTTAFVDLVTLTETLPQPTIVLSGTNLNENLPAGTAVGSLSMDGTASWTSPVSYSFDGGTNDSSFQLAGSGNSNLQSAAKFDYETKSSYSIRIRATDSATPTPNSTNSTFTIAVNNVSEPARLFARGEAKPGQTLVGTLESLPGDNTSVTYAKKAGTFDEAMFAPITGNQLHLSSAPVQADLGKVYYVDVEATGNNTGSMGTMLIKVTVVENQGTLFLIF